MYVSDAGYEFSRELVAFWLCGGRDSSAKKRVLKSRSIQTIISMI